MTHIYKSYPGIINEATLFKEWLNIPIKNDFYIKLKLH